MQFGSLAARELSAAFMGYPEPRYRMRKLINLVKFIPINPFFIPYTCSLPVRKVAINFTIEREIKFKVIF